MLSCLLKGFKIFANKKTLLIIILFLISFFGLNYLINYLVETFYFGSSFSQLPMYIIGYYGYGLILLVLGFFGVFFVSNYVSYLIAHAIFKSKKNPIQDISMVLSYTFFMSVVFMFFYFLMYLVLLRPGIISIILTIIVAIFALVATLVSSLAILFLPVSKTLKESFDRSWLFLKKKFWWLVLIMILLGIITFIIGFAFEYMSILWLSESPYIDLILQSVTSTITGIYVIAVIVYFLKKKK